MIAKMVLSWFLLAVMLASGAAQAAIPDRGSRLVFDGALQVTLLQRENHTKAAIHGGDSRLSRQEAVNRSDIGAFFAEGGNTSLSDNQLALTFYALGCVVYLAFIFLLGLLVGFNDLDKDK